MRENIQKIEVDAINKKIICGDLFVLDQYISKLDWRYIGQKCGIGYSLDKKTRKVFGKKVICSDPGSYDKNKKLSEKLGIPPKYYAKMLRGAQYNLWIKPEKDLISKLCVRAYFRGNVKIDDVLVRIFYKHHDIIKQYEKDGLYNLIPFAFYYGKTTEEMKKSVGKSLWKSLCKNSFTRNKLLAEHHLTELGFFNQFTSTFLKKYTFDYNSVHPCAYQWLNKYLKDNKLLTKANRSHVRKLQDTIHDTLRMGRDLGKKFNVNWSLEKLEEKHKEFTNLINAKKYSDKFIECLKDISVKEYSNGKYTAYLLDSRLKIHNQGQTQHHCVASYCNKVADGDYLVYDVQENGKTVSTLGVDAKYDTVIQKDSSRFRVSQHYGPCNEIVDDDLKEFGQEIVKKLNETVDK